MQKVNTIDEGYMLMVSDSFMLRSNKVITFITCNVMGCMDVSY